VHVKEDSSVITGQRYVMQVKCTPLWQDLEVSEHDFFANF